MNEIFQQKIYHTNVNVDLMEENKIQTNGGIAIISECTNVIYVKKDYVWNHSTSSCENEKYLASIMDESEITRKQRNKNYCNK